MSDFEAPTPVLPPPLPTTVPQPVLPAGSPYAGAAGPYYRPPEYFEVAAPTPGGGSDWILWGVGGVIVLLIGLGAGFLVAVRSGPSHAVAKAPPPPAWSPAAPPRVVAPSPAPIRIALAPAPVPSQVTPAVKLPTERELDLQLKQMWQKGEAGGLTFRTIKTLKSVRQSGTFVQPVAASIKCSFPKAVLFLQSMRDSMPSTALESFQIAPDAADPASLQADMTFGFYFQPEAADASIASGPPAAADIARGLAELGNRAAAKYQFVSISLKAERAEPGVAAPPPVVTLVARTESDVEVGAYMRSLNQSGRFSDVNLVVSDTEQYAGRTYRKFTVELKLAPKPRYGSPVGTPGMPLQAGEVFDPFQPVTSFRQMPPSAMPGFGPSATPSLPAAVAQPRRPVAPPRSPEQDKADLTRAVQQLSLESVTTNGRTRACVINGRLYRVGDVVNGVTVDAIGDDTVTIRKGEQKFELNLPKN